MCPPYRPAARARGPRPGKALVPTSASGPVARGAGRCRGGAGDSQPLPEQGPCLDAFGPLRGVRARAAHNDERERRALLLVANLLLGRAGWPSWASLVIRSTPPPLCSRRFIAPRPVARRRRSRPRGHGQSMCGRLGRVVASPHNPTGAAVTRRSWPTSSPRCQRTASSSWTRPTGLQRPGTAP